MARTFQGSCLVLYGKSIVQQGVVGNNWDYNLTAVYGVFFINFSIDKEDAQYFCKDVALMEKRSGKVFNNKFRQIFIELPKFRKSEKDCETFFECWIYNLVNMDKLEQISFKEKKAIFDRLEKIASQANLTKEERAQYEREWKIYNDYFNVMESAEKKARMEKEEACEKAWTKGLAEGEALARLKDAQNFKALGVSTDIIMKATGLSLEEINNL